MIEFLDIIVNWMHKVGENLMIFETIPLYILYKKLFRYLRTMPMYSVTIAGMYDDF